MKRKWLNIFLILIFIPTLSFGQYSESQMLQALNKEETQDNELQAQDFLPNAQIAMSTPGYLVTAGDVYNLSFAAGSNPVTYTILVDTSYRVRVANMAIINAEGKTFIELKEQVEAIVAKNYPLSGVQFVLLNPAVFKVTVTGEVKNTAEPQAWSLTRLSQVIRNLTTDWSSIRNISVRSINGKTRSCDLFRAQRFGELEQDPYVRPGDVIQIQRSSKKVSISGAVERPGSYQLLPGEGLKELVEYYGGGLVPTANIDKIELVRQLKTDNPAGSKTFLTKNAITGNYPLVDRDTVTIASYAELMPVMFVEGAVKDDIAKAADIAAPSESNTPTLNDTNRIPVRFYEGETYQSFSRRHQSWFTPKSDIENAYILRNNTKILLNLDRLLFDPQADSRLNIQPNDVLIVPFKQYHSTVVITGEVTGTVEISVWPVKRLSTAIHEYLTEYSSLRDVVVTPVEGESRTYDLFMASRFGDLSQNPYLNPGERVTIKRISRVVTIAGEVERPGSYQLLPGEGLKELVEYYGNGFTPVADPSRIELVRYLDSQDVAGNKLYLEKKDIESNFKLHHFDKVSIPAITELIPVMFFEGSLGVSEGAAPEASTRIPVRFNRGENYASLVRSHRDWFGAVSDTANAYIIRDTARISINLNPMLYDANYISEYTVRENDILIIPFRQYFVSVSGAVANPGRYPYIPDRDWTYYIALAGGFDPVRNSRNTIEIRDITGRKLSLKENIGPETIIEAKSNAFLYYFNQYAPVITTTLSILTTVFTIIAVTR